MALAVAHGLLRSAVDVDGADNRTVHGVDHGRVGRGVAPDIDALIEGVKTNPIRVALHFNILDGGRGLGVEHDHRVGAREAVSGLGIDRCSMPAIARNLAGRFQRIEIENRDLSGVARAHDIQTATGVVGVNIVKPAVAADFGRLENLVGSRGRSLG